MIEEEPTMQLSPDHTINGKEVTVLPIPKLDIEILQVKLLNPISFIVGNNNIIITDIYAEGGEGIIYKGTLNG